MIITPRCREQAGFALSYLRNNTLARQKDCQNYQVHELQLPLMPVKIWVYIKILDK